jgi:hypothetical protein
MSDDGISVTPYDESTFNRNEKKNFDKNAAENKANQ